MKWQKTVWTAVAALLAVALVFVVPFAHHRGSASPHGMGMQLASHSHEAQTEQDGRPQGYHVALHADCDASATVCCCVTHCHQGLTVAPHEIAFIAYDKVRDAAAGIRVSGSEPRVLLPPPRRLLA